MKNIFLSLVMIAILAVPGENSAQTTPSGTPGSTGNQPYDYCLTCTGSIWYNTSAINAIDGQYCTAQLQNYLNCYQDQCYRSRYLTCSNFNFSIPSNAMIKGICAKITGKTNLGQCVKDSTIKLSMSGNPLVGINMASPAYWTLTDSTRVYGSSTELWGTTWAPNDINSNDFGVYIKLFNTGNLTPSLFIDEVTLAVTYAIGTGVNTQTQSSRLTPLHVYNAGGNMQIRFEMPAGIGNAELSVYDMSGRKCFFSKLEAVPGEFAEMQINADAEEFTAGMYMITVSAGNEIYSVKTMIEK